MQKQLDLASVNRVDRRRIKALREEVGTKACIVDKIVRSRIKWAGQIVRIKNERCLKRSETKKQGVCIKRGRPGWEDCLYRDLRKDRKGW